MAKKTKYIVMTGGVISGLGKGVAVSSIGNLLKVNNLKIVPIKCDGYLNVDPGTMNPTEHGEVFVLDDGAEVDMDFGHYERFLDVTCKKEWSFTMGKVFNEIRIKERNGDYLGQTVELIPHVTDYIKSSYQKIGEDEEADVVIIEIGGAVGQIENNLYIEACRQLRKDVGKENILYVHLTYIPVPACVHEQKSKPTQQSVDLLRQKGILPDLIIGRCSEQVTDNVKRKISIFCDVEENAVISGIDVKNIYEVPICYENEGIEEIIKEKFNLKCKVSSDWRKKTENLNQLDKEINIAICGKYTGLEDSYASVIEALKHCSAHLKVKINISLIETTHINSEKEAIKSLKDVDGIIVPGGFGTRGIEGKIKVISEARKEKIPLLGICYGLQLATVEFARNVCGIKDANTMEVEPNTSDPIITYMDEQKNIVKMGGTMRLGAYKAKLEPGIIRKYYEKVGIGDKEKKDYIVSERHRHRLEVNPDYVEMIEKEGLIVSGTSFDRNLVEFIELDKKLHPYFVATQAHPELKSSLLKPAPLFYGLVENAIDFKKKK